jgi:DNA-directed RNA polymerase specialized sigma24 family protein
MHQVEHERTARQTPIQHVEGDLPQGPAMTLYTRYEHGNVPVRVYQDDDGETLYEVTTPSEAHSSGRRVERFASARALMRSIYGHDVHMPFDRYFRLGKYRQAGRASGQADLLTLLETGAASTRRTDVVVHHRPKVAVEPPKQTEIVVSPPPRKQNLLSSAGSEVQKSVQVEKVDLDPEIEAFIDAMGEDLLPREAFMPATPEMKEAFDKAFVLELDRVEGIVGIDLGAHSERRDATWKADEVRKLLWRGFAGKMLSQGYDPEDVLQEVYRGLLVRNRGKCPWDGRKSTFGHYVHMVISCVLTNYHRKQARRIDKDALSLSMKNRDGEELGDVGQWGSCTIEHGCEVGDRLALDGLARYLEQVPSDVPEAVLGRRILPMVAAGQQRGEIVRETGSKPSLVSRALAWLRRQTAEWARSGGHEGIVPAKYKLA